MAKVEHDEEMLELAIAREVEAYHFYTALANRVKNQQNFCIHLTNVIM